MFENFSKIAGVLGPTNLLYSKENKANYYSALILCKHNQITHSHSVSIYTERDTTLTPTDNIYTDNSHADIIHTRTSLIQDTVITHTDTINAHRYYARTEQILVTKTYYAPKGIPHTCTTHIQILHTKKL